MSYYFKGILWGALNAIILVTSGMLLQDKDYWPIGAFNILTGGLFCIIAHIIAEYVCEKA